MRSQHLKRMGNKINKFKMFSTGWLSFSVCSLRRCLFLAALAAFRRAAALFSGIVVRLGAASITFCLKLGDSPKMYTLLPQNLQHRALLEVSLGSRMSDPHLGQIFQLVFMTCFFP